MIQVTEVAFTAYPVTDVARARAFYEGLLGLRANVLHDAPDSAWIEYEVGPHTIAITNMAVEWKPSPNGPSMALEVADFDAAVADLRTGGVRIALEPFESPVCHMCVVLDPDGNSLIIHKRKPELLGDLGTNQPE